MAQPTTRRVKTSRTATRYNHPWPVSTPVGITDPELIGLSNGKVLHAVRSDRSAVAAVGGPCSILGALPGEDPFLAHEAGNAVASSRTTQRMSQPWAAIGLTTAGKFLPNARAQAVVLNLARSGLAAALLPVVIAAARDQKSLA